MNLPLDSVQRCADYDLVCFSHQRWDSVVQRPKQILTRFAWQGRVLFIEEPLEDDRAPYLDLDILGNIVVATPRLPPGLTPTASHEAMRGLLDDLFEFEDIERYVLWNYTPKALPFAEHLAPLAVVLGCVEELSAFAGAPPELLALAAEALQPDMPRLRAQIYKSEELS